MMTVIVSPVLLTDLRSGERGQIVEYEGSWEEQFPGLFLCASGPNESVAEAALKMVRREWELLVMIASSFATCPSPPFLRCRSSC